MKKRVIGLWILLSLMMSLFSGCVNTKKNGQSSQNDGQGSQNNGQGSATEAPVTLWWAYNTENLMQDLEYPELMDNRDSTLRMQGIRGDVESVQLMITPTEDIAHYDFTMADLKNAQGDVLKADTFEVFAQWYTEVSESYNNSAYNGFYPDALVPLENYQIKGYDSIKAGQNQGLWIQVNIPADQNPGVYTGSGTLDVDGVKVPVSFEITVYDATMPEEVHVRSQFAVWFDLVEAGEGYYSEELGQAYYDFLASKRVMPTKAVPSVWSVRNISGFTEWAAQQAADPKISAYSLPYGSEIVDGNTLVSESGVMELLTALAQKSIALRQEGDLSADLFKKAVYYLGSICDEPSGSRMQIARDCDLIITRSKRAVADAYLTEYPDLYESCMKVPHIITSAYNAEMVGSDTVGGVQTWCGQFHTWHSEQQRQNYYNRRDHSEREYGEGLWWYGCESPRVPFPSFHMDDDGIVTRLISWMMFDYDVDGMLYWCVNYYQTEDIYTQPSVYLNTVGDGQLLYPGAKFDIFGPLSSRRLESIREGFEDYEYLLMIENHILAYNEANGTSYDPKEMMDYLYEGLYDGMVPERENSDMFSQRRIEVLKLLEQFTADPAGAIETMENKQA